MSTPSSPRKPHIYFLPMMAPGHLIPMIDIARELARNGAASTIITTPLNAAHFSQTIDRDRTSHSSQISISLIDFPGQAAGLPDGIENLSSITTPEMSLNFITAMELLQNPVEDLLSNGNPDCLVAGAFFWWATDVAHRLNIPRIVFYGTGFFPMCVWMSLRENKPYEKVETETEEFVVPDLPDEIRLSRRQLADTLKEGDANPLADLVRKVIVSEEESEGMLVNTFYEMEPAYASHYREIGRKAWHIGPVSMFNKSDEDKAVRGYNEEVDRDCLSWLDSKQPNSVVYVCFGSMAIFSAPQLLEIATGLENSSRDFVWVVSNKKIDGDWLPEGFEGRIEGRGLVIRGWAPQVRILGHMAVGGFVTHCGWNSLLEGVAAGVPMVTWPLSAEQFFNEKLVTEVLRMGIPVGAAKWARRTDDRKESVKQESIERAVVRLMGDDEEAEGRRMRARELGEAATRAVEEGGSSRNHLNSFLEEMKNYRSHVLMSGSKFGEVDGEIKLYLL